MDSEGLDRNILGRLWHITDTNGEEAIMSSWWRRVLCRWHTVSPVRGGSGPRQCCCCGSSADPTGDGAQHFSALYSPGWSNHLGKYYGEMRRGVGWLSWKVLRLGKQRSSMATQAIADGKRDPERRWGRRCGGMGVFDNMHFFHISAKGRPYLPKLRQKELLKQGSWYHNGFITSSQVLGHSHSKM